MRILSIETSCDETGISILECSGDIKSPSFKVLATNLNSQAKLHAPYGGVYPNLAKREHIKILPLLLEKTLQQAKLHKNQKPVDLIAITYGPGLEPALWSGITFALELSNKWEAAIVPVNHMEGHILSVFAKNNGSFSIPEINFPLLSLLVSGGHTELVLSNEWLKYKVIGETLDDAAGEAFDKAARMLGLSYPGGPQISKLAEEERKKHRSKKIKHKPTCPHSSIKKLDRKDAHGNPIFQKKIACTCEEDKLEIALPRPMLKSPDLNFSFSGLKTATLYLVERVGPLDKKLKRKIALEFENAVVETLTQKTKKAIQKHQAKTIIVAGGVSANKYLKKEMEKIIDAKKQLLFPNKDLSTDNSIMIGVVGYLKFLENKVPSNLSSLKAEGGLKL